MISGTQVQKVGADPHAALSRMPVRHAGVRRFQDASRLLALGHTVLEHLVTRQVGIDSFDFWGCGSLSERGSTVRLARLDKVAAGLSRLQMQAPDLQSVGLFQRRRRPDHGQPARSALAKVLHAARRRCKPRRGVLLHASAGGRAEQAVRRGGLPGAGTVRRGPALMQVKWSNSYAASAPCSGSSRSHELERSF